MNTWSTRRSAAAAPTSCATTWAPRTRSKSALRSEAPHPPPELGEVSGGGKPGRETCRAFFLSFPQPSETVAEAGFGGSPCPVGREPLFPRQDIHVLTRARAIHGALVAAPARPDTAHLSPGIRAVTQKPETRG